MSEIKLYSIIKEKGSDHHYRAILENGQSFFVSKDITYNDLQSIIHDHNTGLRKIHFEKYKIHHFFKVPKTNAFYSDLNDVNQYQHELKYLHDQLINIKRDNMNSYYKHETQPYNPDLYIDLLLYFKRTFKSYLTILDQFFDDHKKYFTYSQKTVLAINYLLHKIRILTYAISNDIILNKIQLKDKYVY